MDRNSQMIWPKMVNTDDQLFSMAAIDALASFAKVFDLFQYEYFVATCLSMFILYPK